MSKLRLGCLSCPVSVVSNFRALAPTLRYLQQKLSPSNIVKARLSATSSVCSGLRSMILVKSTRHAMNRGVFFFLYWSQAAAAVSSNKLRYSPITRSFHKTRLIRKLMAVPNITEVRTGAAVSIVLKADQPTGREVTGQVQDVLTRGNHPRGIKVRLRDGRIGRVQRMIVGDDIASDGSERDSPFSKGVVEHGRCGPDAGAQTQAKFRNARSSHRGYVKDMRLDDHLEPASEQIDLMAYVKPGKHRKARNKQKNPTASQQVAEVSCPVCGQFKGDEAAVAHHVDTHFRGD